MSILGRRELAGTLPKSCQYTINVSQQRPRTIQRAVNERTPSAMSQSKRPANDAFGSNQLVKRAKSDANLDSTAIAISSGTGQNGALVQAVCLAQDH